MTLDINYVRSQFPALSGDWTFLDNAGGSQTPESVVQRIREYLLTSDVQHGGSYAVSQLAEERVAAATKAMATFVGAADPCEIVMGPSTSMLMRVLSLCLAETFSPGDEVIVTNLDHEANIGPWVDLAKKGMIVRTWRVNPDTWELRLDELEALLSDRTRLVALTHASNVVGRVNPIKDIARLVHDHGAMICVDGVAYAPHRRIDVQDLDVDFYGFSFYKVYGPHYALLYGKRDHLHRIPGINHFFIDEVPYKFQPGNVNFELTYAMMGVWDYLVGFAQAHGREDLASDRRGQLTFAFDTIARYEETLAAPLLEFLGSKPNVRVIGPPEADRSVRMPTVSFVVEGRKSDSITLEVDKHKMAIRYGDFYARRLIDDLGLVEQNGVVRVSMVHYNTLEEIHRLIGVLDGLF